MRTRHTPLIAAALAAFIAGPALAQEDVLGDEDIVEIQVSTPFIGADGSEIGTAHLVDVPIGGLLISAQIDGLPGGKWHGFHIHEGGECDAEGGFESAGGHFNPTDADHGYLVESGSHAGDMPNQYVPEDGTLRTRVHNPNVSLDGEEPSVRGRTLMVHADPDDYTSQPSGNAGERIACAVIPE